MRHPSLLLGALLGGLTSLPLIALSYLGERVAGLPFVPFDLFDWLARILPGRLITAVIDAMVSIIVFLGLGEISTAAKRLEQAQGILMVIVGGVIVGLVLAWALRRTSWPGPVAGAAAGLVVFLFVAAVEIGMGDVAHNPVIALLWLALLIVGWGALLGTLVAARDVAAATPDVTAEFRVSRRAFLLKLTGGSATVVLAAWGLGRLLGTQRQESAAGAPLPEVGVSTPQPTGTARGETPTATPALVNRIEVPPGARPELTPNGDFYRIDIDTRPPVVDQSSWVLEVKGLFDNPRPLTLSDLMAYPVTTQPITISCISNPIGGGLIGTSNWTGVPFHIVLKDLGLRPEAQEIYIEAVDGFYESVVMADMTDPRTLLVYGMNGDTLPQAHGFPLRIYIPNHYGMKQPKWIKSIEAIDHHGPGYWVERGWNATAIPHIVSIIDTVATDAVENGKVPVGGIAWAGDRGIQKVEVQVDDGAWAEAALRLPPLSSLTWVLWRYDWPTVSGEHTFRVRATDGTGTVQVGTPHPAHPDGATGYHSVTATI
jgi:DMSO/TMAO reductase YedYZ molybdopterin-dependent catalytic subunit